MFLIGKKMKIKLITYATGEYKKYENRLHEFAKQNFLFNEYECFDDTWLKQKSFYEKNKWIFDNIKIGAGCWLWKPYLILCELEKIKDGDAVVYMDSQDLIKYNNLQLFKQILFSELSVKNYCLVQGPHPTISWTKYDCFYFMNCLEPKYFSSKQLEAGFIAFVKNNKTIHFVKEWLGYCMNHFVLLDYDSIMNTEHELFKRHRWDQAVLTLLSIKHNMLPSNFMFNLIDYNAGECHSTHHSVTNKIIKTYFE
jgi:hypothetical protein